MFSPGLLDPIDLEAAVTTAAFENAERGAFTSEASAGTDTAAARQLHIVRGRWGARPTGTAPRTCSAGRPTTVCAGATSRPRGQPATDLP